jgi:hypothetical protein
MQPPERLEATRAFFPHAQTNRDRVMRSRTTFAITRTFLYRLQEAHIQKTSKPS